MNKIVNAGIKIDLHIHSIYSANKDGMSKVMNNTLQNINVLISKLNENGIEMCSITDHDNFNYNMYKVLKKEENTGNSIRKVLPGVEFSVDYEDGKVIHIVTIFNDDNDEKVKSIEDIFSTGIGKSLYQNGSYVREDYFRILREINLDFIMIAHQKKSPTSVQKAKKADVMSLGQEIFDELLFMEYFDAYEFHDKSNEVHNKRYGLENKVIDKLRFITGTDCHDWPSYPNHEPGKFDEVNFTYLKALPTFKGLAMAITDYHRINYTNSFFGQGKCIENAVMDIEGNAITIPFSKGINVIIGDNSVGKSLFLHALTGNRALTNKRSLKKGYDKYLDKNNFQVETIIPEESIFKFNYQGEIREIFDDPNMKADQYLTSYFPDAIDAAKYRNIVKNELNKFFKCIEHKFAYDDRVQNLQSFTILEDEPVDKELIIGNAIKTMSTTKLKKLITDFDEVTRKLSEDILLNPELRESDKNHIKTEIEYIKTIKLYYEQMREKKQLEKEKINIFNTQIKEYKEDYLARQTDESNQFNSFIESKQHVIEDIIALIEEHQQIKSFDFNVEEMDIIPEQNPVDKYIFVSKIGIEKINNEYLEKLITEQLKKGKSIDISSLNKSNLKDMIVRFPNDIEDPLEGLKIKVNTKLDEDFKIKQTITENSMDVYDELSEGFNSRIYFRLLTGEEKNKGIYIIDQPEDHISQKAIKEEVLDQFRIMSKKRQIIIVTHNPQFIVNLDVDNVIYLSKENGKITVKSGALEYEDLQYNILKIVADNIDGGLKTIKERMKKYDKDLQV